MAIGSVPYTIVHSGERYPPCDKWVLMALSTGGISTEARDVTQLVVLSKSWGTPPFNPGIVCAFHALINSFIGTAVTISTNDLEVRLRITLYYMSGL